MTRVGFTRFVAGAVANRVSPLLAIAVFACFGAVLEFSSPLNHDVGWLMVATQRLLDGADVYRTDVIEWNPPLILYLFAPPVGLSRITGLSEISLFRGYVVILAMGSLLLCSRLLIVAMPGRDQLRRYFLAVLALVFLVTIDRDFGQREHLVLIFAMPFVLAVAARAGSHVLPAWLGVLAGVGGGLGMAIKPHFAVAWVALELFLAIRRRSWRSFLRLEVWVAGLLCAVYAVSILILTPGYLDVVMPLALDAYWSAQQPLDRVVGVSDFVLLAAASLAALTLRRDRTLCDLAFVLLIVSVGFYLAVLLQSVGWRYVKIPFVASSTSLIALAVLSALGRLESRLEGRGKNPNDVRLGPAARLLGAISISLLLVAALVAHPRLRETLREGAVWRSGGTTGLNRQLVEVIDQYATGGSVYFLSVGVGIAFPAVNYSQAQWASRFACLWPLTAVVRARGGDPRAPGSLTPVRIDALERYLRDSVVEDFERHQPELVFVDLRSKHSLLGSQRVDMLEFFGRDSRFTAIWSRYRSVVKLLGPYEVYARLAPGSGKTP